MNKNKLARALVLAVCAVPFQTLAVPEIDVRPSALDFGEVPVGSSHTIVTMITNSGDTPLSLYHFSHQGSSDYSLGDGVNMPPYLIEPGTSVEVPVVYTPTDVGEDRARLTFDSDDTDESQAFAVAAGTGVLPAMGCNIDISTLELDFGTVPPASTSDPMEVTISNTGTADCVITDLSMIGSLDFHTISAIPSLPFTVAPGQQWALAVRYEPLTDGDDNAVVSVSSDDSDEPTIHASLKGSAPAPAEPTDPSGMVDLDIIEFDVDREWEAEGASPAEWIEVDMEIRNAGEVDEERTATLTAEQNGALLYNREFPVRASVGLFSSREYESEFRVDDALPGAVAGPVTWTFTIHDDNADEDVAVDTVTIYLGPPPVGAGGDDDQGTGDGGDNVEPTTDPADASDTTGDNSSGTGDNSDDTSGGDTSGGDTSGGDTSGGDTSGGDTSGGDTSGGDTSGGDTSGGDTSGGDTSGGDTSGGDTSGGDTSGGDTSGGDTSGGDTSGGDTSGGDTSGGDTSGGDTSGGDTSGGDTSGGDTSGGDTSGGDTSGGDSGSVDLDILNFEAEREWEFEDGSAAEWFEYELEIANSGEVDEERMATLTAEQEGVVLFTNEFPVRSTPGRFFSNEYEGEFRVSETMPGAAAGPVTLTVTIHDDDADQDFASEVITIYLGPSPEDIQDMQEDGEYDRYLDWLGSDSGDGTNGDTTGGDTTGGDTGTVDLDILEFDADREWEFERDSAEEWFEFELKIGNRGEVDEERMATLTADQEGVVVFTKEFPVRSTPGQFFSNEYEGEFRISEAMPDAVPGPVTLTLTIHDDDADADVASEVIRIYLGPSPEEIQDMQEDGEYDRYLELLVSTDRSDSTAVSAATDSSSGIHAPSAGGGGALHWMWAMLLLPAFRRARKS